MRPIKVPSAANTATPSWPGPPEKPAHTLPCVSQRMPSAKPGMASKNSRPAPLAVLDVVDARGLGAVGRVDDVRAASRRREQSRWAFMSSIAMVSTAAGGVEALLYVVDTPDGPKTTRVYDIEDGKAVAGRRFFDAMPGFADGIRCDTHGNVWAGFSGGPGHDGVAVFAADGTLIGRILLPERCANLCFGGRKRNLLFMTASQSVYAL